MHNTESLDSLLSNKRLAEFLDSFEWEYHDGYDSEFIRIDKIFAKNIMIGLILQNLKKLPIDNKKYSIQGHFVFRRYATMPRPKAEKQRKNYTVRAI